MDLLNSILAYTIEQHSEQTDKSGLPYIIHPIYIALKLESEEEKIVALLHDILEDTNTTIGALKSKFGLSDEVLEAIELLTRVESEPYLEYIVRVSKNKLATKVKIQDLMHNMDLSRLCEVTERDMLRNKKYQEAFTLLKQNNKV